MNYPTPSISQQNPRKNGMRNLDYHTKQLVNFSARAQEYNMRKNMREKIAVTPGMFPTADDFSILESANHRTIATAGDNRG